MKNDQKIVLLYSGGMDSSLLLELAIALGLQPFCVMIDYAQMHIKELEFAVKYCDEKKVRYRMVSLVNLDIRSKLTGEEAAYVGVSEWHVPSRNLMFVGIAASIAESKGIDTIWYGANYGDRENLFPDCYQEWVHATNNLLKVNGSVPIKLEAPLLGITKETIERLTDLFNISKDKIFSGYGREE